MARAILLDTFPLSSTAKSEPRRGVPATMLDSCRSWIKECIRTGNRIIVPAITYYEVLRELERLNASTQIARLKSFCHSVEDRFLSITDTHLEQAAKLWAHARNLGTPTASPEAIDSDVILAAQVLSLGLREADYVVATTNVAHLSLFVSCEHWTKIVP